MTSSPCLLPWLAGAALSALLPCSVQAQSTPQSYTTTYVALSKGQPGLLLQPIHPTARASIGVFAMHDNGDYLSPSNNNPCTELAKRGYSVVCANSTASKSGFFSDDDIEKLLLNVKAGVSYLRGVPSIRHVVIFGHSGGGEMMTAYQNIAEHGVTVCQGSERLIPCTNALADMPPADGVMLVDAVLGGTVSTLISLDPAVIEEGDGQKLDPALDMYNPANGFNPKGSTYSAAFKAKFFKAQGARMNRLIDYAEERLKLIETGKGRFADDEPLIIAGAMGAMNRLNAQDLTLMAHTRAPWPLVHPDGSITTQIVPSVRVPRFEHSSTPNYARGAITTSVRKFLSTWAIRTTPEWSYDASGYKGLDYGSSWADEVDSIAGVTKPLLQVSLTGSYEFINAETAREHATGTRDKTLMYIEGAVHEFTPCHECATAQGKPADYYGDTVKTLFDTIDHWLAQPGRFLT